MIKNTSILYWNFDICIKPSSCDIDYSSKTIMPYDTIMSFITTQSLTLICNYNYNFEKQL
jgi:hypothetical protein